MATYKYLDYEGLKIFAQKVNDKINSVTTSSIDPDDIEWDTLVGPTLGTFYIENVPYSFEIGMTWEDWCSSEYAYESGSVLICIDSIITTPKAITCVGDENYTITRPSDSIINNHTYHMIRIQSNPDGGSDD